MVDGVSEVSREKNLSGWINLECQDYDASIKKFDCHVGLCEQNREFDGKIIKV